MPEGKRPDSLGNPGLQLDICKFVNALHPSCRHQDLGAPLSYLRRHAAAPYPVRTNGRSHLVRRRQLDM